MDEFEGKARARKLHGWVLSPEDRDSLKLVLRYEPGADAAGGREELVQLLLPPEAALYLADELSRQAQRSLDQRAGGPPIAGAPIPQGHTSRSHRARKRGGSPKKPRA